MASLKRDQILSAKDMKKDYVDVPEWGGEVCLKSLTGTERDDFEASMIEVSKTGKTRQNLRNLRARLVVLCAIDPDDDDLRLFSDSDVHELGRKSAAALDRVFAAAQKLNGFTKEDIEDLAEGFESGPSESSTSA